MGVFDATPRSHSTEEYERAIARRTSQEWKALAQDQALAVFHAAAERVPAYQQFLRDQNVDPTSIQSIDDFVARVPVTTKENYIAPYPLAERCVDGVIAGGSIISYSSGSSGVPTLWPRFESQEIESVLLHDLLLRSQFAIHERKTLLVVCFALGIHIAGVITTTALERLLGHGYPISLVTPGKNMDDVVDIITRLGPAYEQVIVFGHPGFLRIVLGELHDRRYAFADQHWGVIASGSGFFEDWRDHIVGLIGPSARPESIVSLYGCTDMGMIAYETPGTVAVRRHLRQEASPFAPLLATETPEPFLFQYIPTHRYIEVVDNELVFTVPSGAPLIRYTLHDRGTVYLAEEIAKAATPEVSETLNHLPFVALYGRARSVIVNGANIYAEDIQRVAEHPMLVSISTGRFFHTVEYTDTFHEQFTIYFELKPGHDPAAVPVEQIKEHVVISLQMSNKEYADCLRALGAAVHPMIIFCVFGDSKLSGRAHDAKKKL